MKSRLTKVSIISSHRNRTLAAMISKADFCEITSRLSSQKWRFLFPPSIPTMMIIQFFFSQVYPVLEVGERDGIIDQPNDGRVSEMTHLLLKEETEKRWAFSHPEDDLLHVVFSPALGLDYVTNNSPLFYIPGWCYGDQIALLISIQVDRWWSLFYWSHISPLLPWILHVTWFG